MSAAVADDLIRSKPSKIIAEDRARVADKIADRILTEAGEG